MFVTKMYPKAHQGRKHGKDPSLTSNRMAFLFAAFKSFVILQLLFLGLFCYIFGAIYQQTPHIHNMSILFIDYDSGAIGESVREAYTSLAGDGFPTLQNGSSEMSVEEAREEVCKGRYWAAFYITSGASSRLENALQSGEDTEFYDPTNTLRYIWNEARYPSIVDSAIASKLSLLSSTARTTYLRSNALTLLNADSSAAVSIFAEPWILTSTNIAVTTQGARIVYNTLVIILLLIQEFFYLGSINALYAQFKIYTVIYPHRIILYRFAISASYTLVGSLCTTAVIYAFRAEWAMSGTQFALTWVTLWLFAHCNFQIMDVLTVWVPAAVMPMALITWMMFNVTSILVPFELSPRFYRWAYVMPAHEAYQVLTDIWSGGCNPKLYYALPILISLEIVAFALGTMGVYRRCHYAVLAEEAQEQALREKVDAAVVFERKKEVEREEQRMQLEKDKVPVNVETEAGRADVEEGERDELASVIREEQTKIERRLSRATTVNFGPSFGVS